MRRNVMKNRTISRRTFLHLGAASGAAAVLAACGQAAPSSLPEAPADAPAAAAPAAPAERMGSGGYYESPMLAERVAAGELPPVDQRLPATPLVVVPLEGVGTYGGSWRTGT